jgi:NAD(P)-dependent dehydrogenase (short-subunit alcohol dehydrogenase family)
MLGPVLIMGGVGGIGEALARRLTAAGTAVVVTSREAARAEHLAAEIGGRGVAMEARDEASVVAAVTAASAGGPLGGLVYAIGSIPLMPLGRLTSEVLCEAYSLNVVGAALAVKHAAAALKAARGSVVLFSSVAARQGFASHAAIGPAKAAVEGLTLALAAELAPSVRVNCIAPSLTDTPLAKPILANEKIAESLAQMHPLQRLGLAEDVATVAEMLLSPAAGWITGQVIGVDGGRGALRIGRS